MEIFIGKKNNIFTSYSQTIDCTNHLAEAVLTSTRNPCFGPKIRKNVYPCIPQFHYINVGYKWVYIARTCLRVELEAIIKTHQSLIGESSILTGRNRVENVN